MAFLSEDHGRIRIKFLQQQLKHLPAGKITVKKCRGKDYDVVYISSFAEHPQFAGCYFSLNKEPGISLSRLIRQYNEITNEIGELQGMIKDRNDICRISSVNKRRNEPQPMGKDFFEDLKKKQDTNTFPKPPDAIEHNGILLRTKGEKILAEHFDRLGLEYVYEPGFLIDGHEFIYPDFAIYLPEIDKVFFLEYMGALGRNNYLYKAGERFKMYLSYGYVPGRDIIYICENDINRLDMETVDSMIASLVIANTEAA